MVKVGVPATMYLMKGSRAPATRRMPMPTVVGVAPRVRPKISAGIPVAMLSASTAPMKVGTPALIV